MNKFGYIDDLDPLPTVLLRAPKKVPASDPLKKVFDSVYRQMTDQDAVAIHKRGVEDWRKMNPDAPVRAAPIGTPQATVSNYHVQAQNATVPAPMPARPIVIDSRKMRLSQSAQEIFRGIRFQGGRTGLKWTKEDLEALHTTGDTRSVGNVVSLAIALRRTPLAILAKLRSERLPYRTELLEYY